MSVMSQPNKLSNKAEDVKKYIDSISTLPQVEKIFIDGSRSPLSKKGPKEYSDWDFVVLTNTKIILPHPRDILKILHVDTLVTDNPELVKVKKNKIVEIYPNNKTDIWNQ